ncbi:MAG: hypothetical protein WAM53_13885, partial [Terrimicrobiaceae bacterium]
AVHRIKYRTLRENRELQTGEGFVEQSSGRSLLHRFYFPLLCRFQEKIYRQMTARATLQDRDGHRNRQ